MKNVPEKYISCDVLLFICPNDTAGLRFQRAKFHNFESRFVNYTHCSVNAMISTLKHEKDY